MSIFGFGKKEVEPDTYTLEFPYDDCDVVRVFTIPKEVPPDKARKAIQKEGGISVGDGTLCTDIPRFALCTSAPFQNKGT